MPKPCTKTGCKNLLFAKGYCKNHQYLRSDRKVGLKKVSVKQSGFLNMYSRKRLAFLRDNEFCKVCGAGATDIHHKAGRVGELLLDEALWLSVCRNCHQAIETNPGWAKENNYSVSRLNK